MNETHEAWQGLGTPAGPQIGWAAPKPASGPVPVPPPLPPAPVASPPVRSRSRPRLAAALAAAILAGGASGAGVVVALDRGAPTAGPTIVQERAPANGSASAGSTEAAARPASCRCERAAVAARGSSWTARVTCSPTTMWCPARAAYGWCSPLDAP